MSLFFFFSTHWLMLKNLFSDEIESCTWNAVSSTCPGIRAIGFSRFNLNESTVTFIMDVLDECNH